MPSNNWGPYFAQSTFTGTATQTYLSDVIVVDNAQQGSPAINAPQTFAGVLAPNAVNSYRWE
jgi:hypothetical protein